LFNFFSKVNNFTFFMKKNLKFLFIKNLFLTKRSKGDKLRVLFKILINEYVKYSEVPNNENLDLNFLKKVFFLKNKKKKNLLKDK